MAKGRPRRANVLEGAACQPCPHVRLRLLLRKAVALHDLRRESLSGLQSFTLSLGELGPLCTNVLCMTAIETTHFVLQFCAQAVGNAAHAAYGRSLSSKRKEFIWLFISGI